MRNIELELSLLTLLHNIYSQYMLNLNLNYQVKFNKRICNIELELELIEENKHQDSAQLPP